MQINITHLVTKRSLAIVAVAIKSLAKFAQAAA